MNQTLSLSMFGDAKQRVLNAIDAFQKGHGVILVDDENRENEGDLIFPAETITNEQMALQIREGSGIVYLCLTSEKLEALALPLMVKDNTSTNQTAFTITIEAKQGVSTGVSAQDRVTTIKTAISDDCKPIDLARPGHIFPLQAQAGGVLSRRGHTEGTVDLAKIAGLKPAGVLCELMHADGRMMRLPELIEFAAIHSLPVLSIDDLVKFQQNTLKCSA